MPPFWTTYQGVIIAEVLLAFTLQTLRVKTRSLMGYELTLKFADESKVKFLETELLVIISVLTAILGWLSDGYTGKVYIAMSGIGAAIGCSLAAIAAHADFFFLDFKEDMLVVTTTLFFFYVSTSGIRNALILEQHPSCRHEEYDQFRRYMMYLILIRIACRLVSNAFFIFAFNDNTTWAVIFIMGTITCIMYLIWLKFATPYLHLEPVYFRIWENCIKCYALSYIHKPHNYKESSRESIMKHLQPEESFPFHEALLVEEPKPTLEKWGFKGIMRDDPPEPEEEHKPVKPERPKPSVSAWMWSFVWPAPKEDVHKPPIVIPKAPPKHWLFLSKPICSEYLIWQAIGLRSTFLIILPGVFISSFMLFIIGSVNYHFKHVILPFENLNKHESTLYWMILDMITFPLFEFVIFPFLRKWRLTDLHFVLTAHSILFVALLVFLHIQVSLEANLQYIPRPLIGQVRIFNGLTTQSTVTSAWFGMRHINPDEYVFITDIKMKSAVEDNRHIRVENLDYYIKEDITDFHLIEKRTITYILIPTGLEQNADKDPSLYDQKNTHDTSLFYLISPVKSNLFQVNISKPGQAPKPLSVLSRDPVRLEAETEYNLTCKFVSVGLRETFRHIIMGPFAPASLNAAFAYPRVEPDGSWKLKVFQVEGPLEFSYFYLTSPLLLVSFANAMASTSYYRFVFLESPEKLRSTMFSFNVSLNIFTMGLFKAYFSTTLGSTVTFIIVQVVAFALMVYLTVNYRFKISTV